MLLPELLDAAQPLHLLAQALRVVLQALDGAARPLAPPPRPEPRERVDVGGQLARDGRLVDPQIDAQVIGRAVALAPYTPALDPPPGRELAAHERQVRPALLPDTARVEPPAAQRQVQDGVVEEGGQRRVVARVAHRQVRRQPDCSRSRKRLTNSRRWRLHRR